mmetsp:Transcript_85053/g.238161  ORF Transcript_85053/g.238161 Transcript_85053/m.238161 type:complete len:268 (+) Transcript_85053:784-1587(+)
MLATTTLRPLSRASRTSATTSAELSLLPWPAALSAPVNLWPAARCDPSASSSGPTYSNLTPSLAYASASSSGTGSCRSSEVVTNVAELRARTSSMPKGSKPSRSSRSKPYWLFILLVASSFGSKLRHISRACSLDMPHMEKNSSKVRGAKPGPAVVSSATLGMPSTCAATAASRFISGQYITAAASRRLSHRSTPGSISSNCTGLNFSIASSGVTVSASRPNSFFRDSIAPMKSGARPLYSSGSTSTSEWKTAPVSSIAPRICSRQR